MSGPPVHDDSKIPDEYGGLTRSRVALEASRLLLPHAPDIIDAAIGDVLAATGVATRSDRCVLISLAGESGNADMTHEWRRDGLEPVAELLTGNDPRAFPALWERLARGEPLTIVDRNDLPKTAAADIALLDELGVASVVAVPAVVEGSTSVVLALGSARPRPAPSAEALDELQLVGNVVAGALRRQLDERVLLASEERADVAVRGTGVGLWVWHVQTGETTFDDRWAEIIGYTLDELQPVSIETWIEHTHPDDLALSNERLQAHFRGETDIYECEARMRHRNGDWVWVLDRGKVFDWGDDGQPLRMAGTHLEITAAKHAEQERERMRGELQQAQKMESIGLLAGGVAHDFNNLLTVISGHAELIAMDGDLTGEAGENLRLIRNAADRARELTQQLLMFSRKQVVRPRPVDLNRQIEQSLKMYGRLISENIALAFTPVDGALTVMADPQQIDQMLGNLLVNARDALHALDDPATEPLISIGARLMDVTDNDAPPNGPTPGRYAVLTVSDNGVGMDDVTRERIFEPFFTTKGRDRGTGLGLATVFGIVQQNGGVIRVYSEPDKGTTFRVFWPLADAPAGAVVERPGTGGPLTGGETIMVVEDDPAVRRFTEHALSRLGYGVITASNGIDALAQLKSMESPPQLMMTDIIMPGLDGAQLAERVRALHPDLPVLFTSGYTDDIIGRQGILDTGIELVEKPYTITDLTQRIRALLDRA
jgi:two-component system cell cycle sensor histidine kinase/response regulator CckA